MQSYHHKEVYDVELKKDASGLGITIAGAEQHGLQGIVVTSITPRGPADCSGKMRTGDQVLTVSTGTAYVHTTPHYTTHTTLHHSTHHTALYHTAHTTLHHTSPHHTTLHYTTLHNTSPHHTAQHLTTLHYTTLHTTPHHTTPHHTNPALFHCKIPSPVGLHHLV